MNKTININLGGYFFHIDEIAYQKLKRYLDAIAKSLSDDPQGKNEIISDIETRISELLSEKITDPRQVVNEQDINDIIKIMGEPEDYSDAEQSYADSSYTYQRRQSNSKKLYRDGEDKFLGGVAAGLGHYFNIDVVWIRLAFILTTVFSGFGLLIYIILWIVIPEATTTAEKLQMEGEAVNIDNIEKKIREEFNQVTETIKDGASEVTKKVNEGFKKGGKKAQSGFQDFLDVLGKIIVTFFKVIGKFLGFILVLVSAIVMVAFIVALFSVGSFSILGFDGFSMPPFVYDSIIPHWLLAICGLIVGGFIFLMLFILGLRILFSNVKQFNKTTSYTLLGIWIIALMILVFSGIEFGTSNAFDGRNITRENIAVTSADTLKIKMVNDDNLVYRDYLRRSTRREEVIVNGRTKTYSNYVKVDIEDSSSDEAYVRIRKVSQGRNKSLANNNAESIDYQYSLKDGTLALNAYFLSKSRYQFKHEVVYVTVYVPTNTTVYFDKSTKSFLHGIYDVDSKADNEMVNHYFLMTEEGLDCTDCEDEIEEENPIKETNEEI